MSCVSACAEELTIGHWACSRDGGPPERDETTPFALPWSTSFEDRFCAYAEPFGFCYAGAGASFRVVTSPVRSGSYAAAFSVVSDDPTGFQTRCVRQGQLPEEAYYGAWYFVEASATDTGVWNLLHFRGGDAPPLRGLWDVSLVNTAAGGLRLVVFDFLRGVVRTPAETPAIPIGAWFHVQLYLKRAADATGKVALYQDGQQIFELTDLITDDSSLGQWYVGNYAEGLMPAASTLYVDDVTIRATL